MALNDTNIINRGATNFPHLQFGGPIATVASTIDPFLLVTMGSAGTYATSAAGDGAVMGTNGEAQRLAGSMLSPHRGATVGLSDDILTPGKPFKAGNAGRVVQFVDAASSGVTMLTTGVGVAFGNQPTNDSVGVLSSNAGDTTQVVTLIGTTNGTNTIVVQTVALNGTTPVLSAKVDWGKIVAVKLSAACVGTITIRKTTGTATITTIAPAALAAGVEAVLAANQQAYNIAPTVVSNGATTKQAGLGGLDSTGAQIYDSVPINGTTAVTANSTFKRVTEVYTGDVENTRTVTLKTGAVDSPEKRLGYITTATTAAGQVVGIDFMRS